MIKTIRIILVLAAAAAFAGGLFIAGKILLYRGQHGQIDSELAGIINESSTLIGAGDNAAARDLLEKAARKKPKNEIVQFNIGVTWMNEGDYEKAAVSFSKSIKIHPTLGALLNRAYSYRALGKNSRAIEDYSRVIVIEPSHVNAYFERGFLYMLEGEDEKARKDLEKALDAGILKAQPLLDRL